jgi:hypothetical protein
MNNNYLIKLIKIVKIKQNFIKIYKLKIIIAKKDFLVGYFLNKNKFYIRFFN